MFAILIFHWNSLTIFEIFMWLKLQGLE